MAELAADSDRLRGAERTGNTGERAVPQSQQPARSIAQPVSSDPTGFAHWVVLTRSIPQVEHGLILRGPRSGSILETMLDDLATEAAELQSQTAAARSDPLAGVPISDAPVPGDAADQPNRPGKPGGLLSRLAVTLLAVGFWGSRASLLGISNRRAGRPHDTRNAKVWKATGLHGSELDDDLDSSNGG